MPTERSYPIATSVKFIKLNNVVFHPSEVQQSTTKHGDFRRMWSGILRVWDQGNYRKWTITWSGLHESQLPAVRTIYALSDVFTYVDELAESIIVVCPQDGLKSTLSATNVSTPMHGIFYDVELNIEEVNPILDEGGV